VPVDGFAWIANRTLSVPTLSGLQPLTLNRAQRTSRRDGQGFPTPRRGARGDRVITVQPVFPERLSTDQDILLDQLLAASLGPDGVSSDPRLARWQRDLGAWRAELQRRDSDTAR
jgi:molecular chaperone DnaJ